MAKKKKKKDTGMQSFALLASLIASDIFIRLPLLIMRTGLYGNMRGSNANVL